MNILIIQENGRHEENRHLRECFSMQRAFQFHDVDCDVWGLGHDSPEPDFESYDLIINLENYDETGWVPDLSRVRGPMKFLWAIDSHVKGHHHYEEEFKRGGYDLVLQATKFYVDDNSVWLPNAYDDDHIKSLDVPKTENTGFCGNIHNRQGLIDFANDNWGCKVDVMVLGDKMVEAINSYKVHMNANIGCDVNYRNFETIGCGTVLAAFKNTNQYDELGFIDGVNCILFESMEECKKKVYRALRDDSYRAILNTNARKLAKQHTYKERVKVIIKHWELLKDNDYTIV